MKSNEKHIYRLNTQHERYVAIAPEDHKVIAAVLEQWGSLENVPVEKTVRGMFVLKNSGGGYDPVDDNRQENDITIRELRPV
jgi:hypothetical protein